jgi:transcriptional regulator with XRE-family HTH domain
MSSGIVFDALMESGGPDGVSITAVIADRVRRLRETARLSGAGLAAEMVKLGVPWNRTTVAKLETGRRESITVQELLALALALDVPPVALLVDLTGATPARVAAGVELDPADALLWMIGALNQTGVGPTGASWNQAAGLLEALQRLNRALRIHEWNSRAVTDNAALTLEANKSTIIAIAEAVEDITRLGMSAPTLPASVLRQAEEFNVALPGVGA